MIENGDESCEGYLVHHTPHQAMRKSGKATIKMWIVHNASARDKKYVKSLSEVLLRGPII